MAGLQTPTTAAAVAETSGTFECNICLDQASDPVVTQGGEALNASEHVTYLHGVGQNLPFLCAAVGGSWVLPCTCRPVSRPF